eukprot:2918838-Rhodomonas_salina.2
MTSTDMRCNVARRRALKAPRGLSAEQKQVWEELERGRSGEDQDGWQRRMVERLRAMMGEEDGVSLEELRWALDCVQSRTFGFTRREVDARVQEREEEEEGRAGSGWSSDGGRSRGGEARGRGGGGGGEDDDALSELWLCPMADMLDHEGGSGGHVTVERGRLILRSGASGAVAPGASVRISYGDLDSAHLLRYYGFVLRENPHDNVQFSLPELGHVVELKGVGSETDRLDRLALLSSLALR